MKDIVTPVPQEEVRHVIKKCLENSALVNYTKVSEMAKIEGNTRARTHARAHARTHIHKPLSAISMDVSLSPRRSPKKSLETNGAIKLKSS